MTVPIASAYKSPLHEMTQTTPTVSVERLRIHRRIEYSLENGAVGATCNPVIVVGVLKKEFDDVEGKNPIAREGISDRDRR